MRTLGFAYALVEPDGVFHRRTLGSSYQIDFLGYHQPSLTRFGRSACGAFRLFDHGDKVENRNRRYLTQLVK